MSVKIMNDIMLNKEQIEIITDAIDVLNRVRKNQISKVVPILYNFPSGDKGFYLYTYENVFPSEMKNNLELIGAIFYRNTETNKDIVVINGRFIHEDNIYTVLPHPTKSLLSKVFYHPCYTEEHEE